jgi:DNA invertase Pin-like site-specific DNA recombinase
VPDSRSFPGRIRDLGGGCRELRKCLGLRVSTACPAKLPGEGTADSTVALMLIGYARVSTSGQDLAAQRDGLHALGVADQDIHVDHGMSGTTRERPGLRSALASVRAGDTLVVTKLDRLARSLRDATDIADELTKKGVALNLGGSVYDPTDPVGRLLFNVLGMVAEFEADLIRARTREGMAIAKAAGKLRGGKPKLNKAQEKHLVELHRAGTHTTSDLAELFGVARATV